MSTDKAKEISILFDQLALKDVKQTLHDVLMRRHRGRALSSHACKGSPEVYALLEIFRSLGFCAVFRPGDMSVLRERIAVDLLARFSVQLIDPRRFENSVLNLPAQVGSYREGIKAGTVTDIYDTLLRGLDAVRLDSLHVQPEMVSLTEFRRRQRP